MFFPSQESLEIIIYLPTNVSDDMVKRVWASRFLLQHIANMKEYISFSKKKNNKKKPDRFLVGSFMGTSFFNIEDM